MKKVKLLLVPVLGVWVSCAGNSGKPDAGSDVTEQRELVENQQSVLSRNVNVDEFERGISDSTVQLIDVRTDEEYQEAHLAGSRQINLYSEDFNEQISKLDKNRPVYVYCRSGARSSQAMRAMTELGIREVYNLSGGIVQWQAQGKAVERP